MQTKVHDVVVVGGGAAGLSAALLLGRARRRVAVVDAGAPRNALAAHMHGFLSRDGMPPADLLTAGRAEVTGYGVELIEDQVVGIDPGLFVRLAGGQVLRARRILLSTGVHDELPDIPGVRQRWGRDLLHCPYCHGWEVRDQPLGVLGTGPGAVQHAQLVRQWSDDVVFFAHTPGLTATERGAAAGPRYPDRPRPGHPARRRGRPADRCPARRWPGDRPHRGVHPPRQHAARRRPAGRARLPDRRRRLRHRRPDRTDHHPGVWAAGNAVDPRGQVIAAAGAGTTAGIAINADLVAEDVDHAVDEHHAAGGVFSAAAEARLAAAFLGERRHGL